MQNGRRPSWEGLAVSFEVGGDIGLVEEDVRLTELKRKLFWGYNSIYRRKKRRRQDCR